MAKSPETWLHKEWLGFVQPIGLVVSATALVEAGAFVDRNVLAQWQALVRMARRDGRGEEQAILPDLVPFCTEVLGWQPADLVPSPTGIEVALPEYGETLTPTYAVRLQGEAGKWLLQIQSLPLGAEMDAASAAGDRGWHAAPQTRFERLLRESQVPIGVLFNGEAIRLVYAPSGESSGHVTFRVEEMCEVAGRPILGALCMLLSAERLFTGPENQRLPAILRASRRHQSQVSTALAEQVHDALNHLLRGLQAADDATKGRLLQEVLRDAPDQVYGGLLTTLMRLVFLLYAEDRDLMPSDEVYVEHYSVTGLFERLREDAARYPDTMDQRFGAWARLLALFRLVFDGGGHGAFHLPPRYGRLFDPDAYPFLEGRPHGSRRVMGEPIEPPRVSDGVICRALEDLLVLDGERLSYRSLDVEQIGSVYEAMMGYTLGVAKGRSIAVKPDHVVVDLDALLLEKPEERLRTLKRAASCEVSGKATEPCKVATTVEGLVEALGSKVSPRTPQVLPKGAMYLQPTEERRRSGSHYTPRSLTEPIVKTTLRPVLEALGTKPTPEQILELKVCDPAMGSGAFLVEACRLLADRLVAAWQAHGETPRIPPDQDPVLHARRLVAQRCLYGVDKNPFAVDLAKLSLWLVTLAKEHPFTFLDHALRCGDSLVGLTREQIACFHWEAQTQLPIVRQLIDPAVKRADALRAELRAMGDSTDTRAKRRLLDEAEDAIADVRLIGDLVIAAFFGADKAKAREALRAKYAEEVERWLARKEGRTVIVELAAALREGDKPLSSFHWEIEFPEVFARESPGFDEIVGNPPFLGGMRVSESLGMAYFSFLTTSAPGAGHLCDLVAYFFRRAFSLLRDGGAFGLIATKTIAQGDTRNGGLTWLLTHGGTVFSASKRMAWPGAAAVVVSVVHVSKGAQPGPAILDGKPMPRISAFLFHRGGDEDPARLAGMNALFSQGSIIRGTGFLIGDNGEPTTLEGMRRILRRAPACASRILPYMGGEELNQSSTQDTRRYVVYLSDIETEQGLDAWGELARIVREHVKPERDALGDNPNNQPLKRRWWAYHAHRPDFYEKIRKLGRLLANSRVSGHLAFAFQPPDRVFAESLNLFAVPTFSGFCVLQARCHEVWSRFLSSSMKDDLRYSPSDCFETFPIPRGREASEALESAGCAYYEHRASLMVANNEGLTATYNRFHDPDERDAGILKLRELHATMDRAVLDAYGWTHLRPTCEFLLDYEEDEDAEKPSKKRKPWRYRWPDDIRDEVLARVLALNKERAEEEARAAAAQLPAPPTPKHSRKGKSRDQPGQKLIP